MITFLLLLVLAAPAQRPDSAAVVRVVSDFHGALAAGDSTAALSHLSPDLQVLESGDRETFAEYRSHHLAADIEFARAVPSARTVRDVRVEGNTAWVTSTSRTEGEFRGRSIRSAGAELMVLTRVKGRWTIRAIHWSSHTIRATS